MTKAKKGKRPSSRQTLQSRVAIAIFHPLSLPSRAFPCLSVSRGGEQLARGSRDTIRDSREGERSLRGAGGARRRGAASLRVIPLVGAGPGHAKRAVFAEL